MRPTATSDILNKSSHRLGKSGCSCTSKGSVEVSNAAGLVKGEGLLKLLSQDATSGVCELIAVESRTVGHDSSSEPVLHVQPQLGLDTFLIDARDKGLMASLWAAQALSGSDRYCAVYLKAYRAGQLEV